MPVWKECKQELLKENNRNGKLGPSKNDEPWQNVSENDVGKAVYSIKAGRADILVEYFWFS